MCGTFQEQNRDSKGQGSGQKENRDMPVLRKIESYLRKSKMPETRFGRMAVNDPRLVRDLRNGREPGFRLTQRIEAFLADRAPR
jgi:hypothetical protein